ncbi:hypothetical protein AGMMS49974_11000 [Deltaproteobacteria bacterium]|nr:hypothetical protein AGMMS49974_11000 [Deltaproteobacteria bacterium]
MHETTTSLSDYRKQIDSALQDDFLRRTLDTFAVAYRANRESIFREVDEDGLINKIAEARDKACRHMEELYARFKDNAEKRGVYVHRAATAAEANDIIARIAGENNVKRIVKSMTAEETHLNDRLFADNLNCGRNRPRRMDHNSCATKNLHTRFCRPFIFRGIRLPMTSPKSPGSNGDKRGQRPHGHNPAARARCRGTYSIKFPEISAQLLW